MTDYLPLLSRAVANLENPEARRKVYDRARQALLAQLRGMNPPLAEAEITRERLALEEAIRRLDQQAARPEAGSPPPPQPAAAAPSTPQSRTPPAPRPPAPASGTPAAPSPRPPAAASGTSPAPPPVPSRERLAPEPPSGSKVVRDAVEGVRPLGSAAAGAARAARGVADEDMAEPAIVPGADPRARFGRDDGPPSTNDLAGRGGRRGTIDYAKADAAKAMKAKLIVGGIVGGLLAVAILIGYVHRDRILVSFGIGSPTVRTAQQPSAPSGSDRIQQSPQTKSGAQSNVPAAAVAQRAVLYEENPGGGEQQLQTFVGTAVWRTETVNPGPGRPPELGLRVDIEIPDRKMTVTISIRRNPDQTLPASHTVEVQFKTPGDPFGGVANLPGVRAKTTETAQGAPLVGLVVRVMPGFFLIGLSNIDADREQNLSLLRERGWLDIPFVYNNGRRSVLVVEKGTPGERAVNEVIAAWGG